MFNVGKKLKPQNNLLFYNIATDKEDSALSFSVSWISELSLVFDKIYIVTFRSGKYDLPKNCEVYNIAKGSNKLIWFIRFYQIMFKLFKKGKISHCFSHMNPLFICLSSFFLFYFNVKTSLWYAHPSITLKLKFASLFCDKIITSFPNSFPFSSSKINVIGQAIDSKLFKKHNETILSNRVLFVGRISRSKNLDYLINEMSKTTKLSLDIYGPALTEDDENYYEDLKAQIISLEMNDRIRFFGPIIRHSLPHVFSAYPIHINLTTKGFGDKVALESVFCETMTLSANNDISNLYPNFKELIHFNLVENDLSDKLNYIFSKIDFKKIGLYQKNCIENTFDFKVFFQKLESVIKN